MREPHNIPALKRALRQTDHALRVMLSSAAADADFSAASVST